MIVPIEAVAVLLVLATIGSNCVLDETPNPAPTSASPDCGRPRVFPDSCEGVWLRAVVGEAGYSINGEGSNAWGVVAGNNEFYFWATQAAEEPPLNDFLKREGYDAQLQFAEGVVHFSSKGLRYVWETQGLLVWIGEPARKVATSVVGRLFNASPANAVPATATQQFALAAPRLTWGFRHD